MTKIPTPADKSVGTRVRQARLLKGMSQEKLGAALGLTFQQIQKYEKGVNRIGAGRLMQISVVLQQPIPWFFEGAGPTGVAPTEPDLIQELGSTSSGQALAAGFLSIKDNEVRRCFLALISAVAGCTNQQFHEKKRRAA